MFTLKTLATAGLAVLLASGCGGYASRSSLTDAGMRAADGPQPGIQYGLGAAPSAAQLSAWNIDVIPDGDGLPAGAGSVAQGRVLYAQACASCHGQNGEGKPMDRLVGGQGTLSTAAPVKTVGSYWPYATGVYDYIRRAMPFDAPGTLAPDQVYAATAYLLYLNGIVPDGTVLDARSLPRVNMPNRNGFFMPDPRPDTRNVTCMSECGRQSP